MTKVIKFVEQIKNLFSESESISGVELGVFKGLNLLALSKSMSNFGKIYAVDPFLIYDEYKDINKVTRRMTQEKYDVMYITTYKNLKKAYGDKIEIIRAKSHEAIDLIPDNLDFYLRIAGFQNYLNQIRE